MNSSNCVFYYIDKKLQKFPFKITLKDYSVGFILNWLNCKCRCCKNMNKINKLQHIEDIYSSRSFNVTVTKDSITISLD